MASQYEADPYQSPLSPDPVESAEQAALRYTTDEQPGLRRIRAGKGFVYVGPDGKRVKEPATLERIRSLAIPPAWTAVWISPDPRGHVQAVGRDARGRKQYRYHPRWRAVRDETKFHRVLAFGRALPALRARVAQHLALPGLPRDKMLAGVVRLLEATLIRVGNEEYARQNGSFGLTTMRDRHARIDGGKVRFEFRGKGGVKHAVDLKDRRLARLVKRCQDLPGEELFQYVDEDGGRHTVGSADVNAYLREAMGDDFTAKDFRTWAATVLAAWALSQVDVASTSAEARRRVLAAIEVVARKLGNTRSICRKCYVHPVVIDAYLDGSLLDTLRQRTLDLERVPERLSSEEQAALELLERRIARERGLLRDAEPASISPH